VKAPFKLSVLLAVLAVVAIGLTGCGGQRDGDAGAVPSTATAPSAGMSHPDTNEAGALAIDSPAAELRVTLDRLLGEHALLAMFATQKGFDGDRDFEAIAGALDRNSIELADAIGSVYGDGARREFLDGDLKWRAHIGFFVDYTVALAENDKAARRKAVGGLKGYVESFSAFLAEATGLPRDAVRMSISEHVNQLKGQIDAYSTGDHQRAYDVTRKAYAHMFMTGDTLAGAIVKQNADDFRR
jgi:hypothetical protein